MNELARINPGCGALAMIEAPEQLERDAIAALHVSRALRDHAAGALARATQIEPSLPALAAALREVLQPATRREVEKALALLLLGFPTSNIPNPQVFARLAVADVCAAGPSRAALESATRRLRRTLKFIPSISEVLETIAAEEKAWRMRLMEVEELPARRAREAEWEERRRREQAAWEEEQRQRERAQELAAAHAAASRRLLAGPWPREQDSDEIDF